MNPKNSVDLFNKIRSQFSNIRLGDENGAATADPSGAVFFEFEFQEDADTFGSVSVSLADGENMKVYYNRDLVNKIDEDSKDEWYAFLKELKDFAVEHQLRFDVRDITKNNLTKQDYENLADTNKTVNTDEMSEELARITKLAGVEVKEGLTGTAKRSYENLNKTKLIIRHKGKVDETVPGARSRQIQSLYIENEDGERFKYPLTHLAGARAMMRHVSNGGRPHDEFGQHIVSTSEDIAKLNSFSRYVTNKDQLNDNAGDIIEQTKLKLENLRGYMKNLSNQAHYENASKDFKTSEEQILDDETVNKMREKFTMTNLDSRVEDALPIINKIMSELENAHKEEDQVNELEPDAEPIDAPVEPPVDHGAVVQSFLNDPDNKLVLRKDDSADKMLKVTKFTNKNTMLSSILSDIASRLLTKSGEEDRVANFASRVADEMEQENSAAFKPSPDYIKNKKIAVQLAKRYIDDYKKMQAEPGYTDQVRMEPGAFAPKKDLKGKAKETEAFEGWVDSMIDEGGIKPYVSMSRGENDGKMMYNVLDRNEKTVYASKDEKAATEFLRKNFDKLRAGEMEVSEYAKMGNYPRDPELAKKDKENATKLNVTKADQKANTVAYQKMKSGDPRYADKTNEGNQFAQAVQKAKAAGMKAGDKFKVGDEEYTLKDAIEMAGLQLEEFFSEEEMEVPAEAHDEAEAINTELDRIKTLANLS
jgi:ribosomal protein L17